MIRRAYSNCNRNRFTDFVSLSSIALYLETILVVYVCARASEFMCTRTGYICFHFISKRETITAAMNLKTTHTHTYSFNENSNNTVRRTRQQRLQQQQYNAENFEYFDVSWIHDCIHILLRVAACMDIDPRELGNCVPCACVRVAACFCSACFLA